MDLFKTIFGAIPSVWADPPDGSHDGSVRRGLPRRDVQGDPLEPVFRDGDNVGVGDRCVAAALVGGGRDDGGCADTKKCNVNK